MAISNDLRCEKCGPDRLVPEAVPGICSGQISTTLARVELAYRQTRNLHMKSRTNFSATALLLFTPLLTAANWPNWRGPDYNGSSPETSLPATFSRTENVKWTAELPGPSAATPVIWGDKVFVSSTDSQKRSLLAICLDRRTGRELWRRDTGDKLSQDDKSNYASPSPVADAQSVFFFYGSGELVAFDHDGGKLWDRNIESDYGPFAFWWTFSTSPVLHDGKLLLQVLQRDVIPRGDRDTSGPIDPYLLALDPATGKELWKHTRPSDARAESREAFTTPTPLISHYDPSGSAQPAERPELLVVGGDCISGHDPDTGRELWRWGTWNPGRISHWRLVPSPVVGGRVVLACAPKGSPVYAFRLYGSGTLEDSWIAWKSEDRAVSTDVSTPLYYQGRFYILNSDRRTLARVEPDTGKVDWVGELATRIKIEASPTAGDGKIYFMSHSGQVFVVAAGPEFEVLHSVEMGDEGDRDLRASISISQGDLYIRTGGKLYCIGR